MAKVNLPPNVRPKPLSDGTVGYFWELPRWARPAKVNSTRIPVVRHGIACPFRNEALGSNVAQAIVKAEGINEGFYQWKEGTGSTLAKGSVKWLFSWYQVQPRFTDKIGHKTREDYTRLMGVVSDVKMKDGTAFGTRAAKAVDATAADRLYAKLKTLGDRQATYAMQVCSRVWNEAVRHEGVTGITRNPFAKMGLSTVSKDGNRATTREEYDLYRETARSMGFQSMATAAALSFELAQRVWDVFGFKDPTGQQARGITWAGYRPGASITIIQSKSGKAITIPLIDRQMSAQGHWDVVPLYPDLEAELALTARSEGLIVTEDRSGRPYEKRRAAKVHRMICEKARLPKEMKFTGFRHGGATEMGDAAMLALTFRALVTRGRSQSATSGNASWLSPSPRQKEMRDGSF